MIAQTIAVLISASRHPLTQRPQRNDQDARALELALQQRPNKLVVVHAGSQFEPSLPHYFGMGLENITLVPCSDTHDPLPLLSQCLSDIQPGIIMCGKLGSLPCSQGFLPYRVAYQLAMPIADDITDVRLRADEIELFQAVAGGRRRRLVATSPVVVTVGSRGPSPRLSAFGKRRNMKIDVNNANVQPLSFKTIPRFQPGRSRPKPILHIRAGASLEERLAFVMGTRPHKKAEVVELSPNEAAAQFIEWIAQRRPDQCT